jgi:hypothetical protein
LVFGTNIDDWAKHHLQSNLGASGFRLLTNYSREITARGVSRDNDTGGIDTNTRRISGNPFGAGIGVFYAGEKLVFRRKSIIHRNDTATTRVTEQSCVSRLPKIQAPPWKYTMHASGSAPADAGVYMRKGNAPSAPRRNRSQSFQSALFPQPFA